MDHLTAMAGTGQPADVTLTLPYDARCRSRQRVTLDDGREAGLFLERGRILRDGDRLQADSGLVVAVVAAAEPVTTVAAGDPRILARACYHLGNRHVPVQIGPGWLRYAPDHVLDHLVRGLGLDTEAEEAPFEPEDGAYAGHHHGPALAGAAG
jgi:urease accessory protein